MRCSRPWGAMVSGLRAGGANDKTTIAAAKLQAAIRAALEPCVPGLMGEPVIGMLSDSSIEAENYSNEDYCWAVARSDSTAGSTSGIVCSMNCLPADEPHYRLLFLLERRLVALDGTDAGGSPAAVRCGRLAIVPFERNELLVSTKKTPQTLSL
jgi:hypothetical protein